MTDSERYASEIAHFIRPEDKNERFIRAYLETLRPHKLERVLVGSREQLLADGFRSGKCHLNCIFKAAAGQQEHVMGWTVTEHVYLAHSVVRNLSDGSLHCITPDHNTDLREGDYFDFIVDAGLSLTGERGAMIWTDGSTLIDHHDVGNLTVIRREVAYVIALYGDIRWRLDIGEITYDQAIALGL